MEISSKIHQFPGGIHLYPGRFLIEFQREIHLNFHREIQLDFFNRVIMFNRGTTDLHVRHGLKIYV